VHVLGVGYSHLAQILVVGQLNIRVRVAMEPRAPNTRGSLLREKSAKPVPQTRTVGVAQEPTYTSGRVRIGQS